MAGNGQGHRQSLCLFCMVFCEKMCYNLNGYFCLKKEFGCLRNRLSYGIHLRIALQMYSGRSVYLGKNVYGCCFI